MYNYNFYNQTLRKYIAYFGSLFNNIVIDRTDKNTGNVTETLKVPIHYAPYQKFLAKRKDDGKQPAIILPRMSYEMTGLTYAPDRKLATTSILPYNGADSNSKSLSLFKSPYDITFQLQIMTKFEEDGYKIVESILPFFNPDITNSLRLIDGSTNTSDVTLVLNDISFENNYEGSYEERRVIIWTLNFTLQAYLFGPQISKKVINLVSTNVYENFNANTVVEDGVLTIVVSSANTTIT